MKIIADENIPFAQALFGGLGELTLLPGRNMRATDVVDADVLLVRSVTAVNQSLLDGSSVRFVGTCTIGTDHLDTAYLSANNITYASAPGCNAHGVKQYVLAVLAKLGRLAPEQVAQQRVAVIGGGNVGSRVYRALTAIGFDCVCIDPFLSPSSSSSTSDVIYADFEAIYTADIVCMHTPYTTSGAHPTHHLVNGDVLAKLKPEALLINAGRGGAIDNAALSAFMAQTDSALTVALDVWESEPAVHLPLLDQVHLGSPHIAGYSLEGRVTGSLMIYEALCQYLAIAPEQQAQQLHKVKQQAYGKPVALQASTLCEAILATYDPAADFARLQEKKAGLPASFDWLRKHYPHRREFSHYCLQAGSLSDASDEVLTLLGFQLS